MVNVAQGWVNDRIPSYPFKYESSKVAEFNKLSNIFNNWTFLEQGPYRTLRKTAVWILQKASCGIRVGLWVPLRISKESLIKMHSHWCGIQTGSLWCQSQSMNWKLYYAFHMWATNLGGRFVLFLSCYLSKTDCILINTREQNLLSKPGQYFILQLHPINLRNSSRSSAHKTKQNSY